MDGLGPVPSPDVDSTGKVRTFGAVLALKRGFKV